MAHRMARCGYCGDISKHEGKLYDLTNCNDCGKRFEMNLENSALMWGWRVVRDYGFDPKNDDPSWNRQGKTYRDYCGGKHRYRLRDEDGKTWYIIDADTPPESDLEARLFAPLEWAMNDVGATSIEYKTKEGWEYL